MLLIFIFRDLVRSRHGLTLFTNIMTNVNVQIKEKKIFSSKRIKRVVGPQMIWKLMLCRLLALAVGPQIVEQKIDAILPPLFPDREVSLLKQMWPILNERCRRCEGWYPACSKKSLQLWKKKGGEMKRKRDRSRKSYWKKSRWRLRLLPLHNSQVESSRRKVGQAFFFLGFFCLFVCVLAPLYTLFYC